MPFSVVSLLFVIRTHVRYPGVVQQCLPLGLCLGISLFVFTWSMLSAMDSRCLVGLYVPFDFALAEPKG